MVAVENNNKKGKMYKNEKKSIYSCLHFSKQILFVQSFEMNFYSVVK